ncbi:MAG: hypothetical protein JXA36_00355, partial [Coriobacteriia bacterium]|nr:hypothetical protein [Coriobacteriia bacterium]
MTETKRARAKPSLGVVLSLGCMALGIAGLIWAGLNIGAHWMRPDAASSGLGFRQVVSALERGSLQELDVESAVPSSAPVPQVLYPVRPAEGDPVGTLVIPALD